MPIYHNQFDSLPGHTERLFRTIFPVGTGGAPCSLHENVLVPQAIIPLHHHSVVEILICLDGHRRMLVQWRYRRDLRNRQRRCHSRQHASYDSKYRCLPPAATLVLGR